MPSARSGILRAVDVCLRVAAALPVAAAAFLLVPLPELRAAQIELALAVQGLEPTCVRGLLVLGTGAGGAVRGDFLLCAAALLALQLLPARRAALAAALSTRRWLTPCARITK